MGVQGRLFDDFIGGKITQPAVAFGKNLQYKVVKVFHLGCTCTYNCAELRFVATVTFDGRVKIVPAV